jgi:PAS domain S-box-containing protein
MENREELKHFLENLHVIFDGFEGFIYVSDPDTYEVLFANDKFRETLGGKCYKVIRGLKAPCPFCTNQKIFGENLGKTYIWEFHSERDKRWYRCVDKAIQWLGKRYVRLEIATDITEYKNMEKALMESEGQYRSLVEAAPDVVYSISSDGKLTSLSSAFEKITGWKREEWLGKPFTALIHPEDVTSAVESFQKTLRGEPEPVELRVLSKSGNYLIGEFISVPWIKNGKIVGELGIARDITSRKLYEEKIQETSKRLQALIQAIPDVIYFKDAQGRNLMVNRAFEKLVGLKHEEIVGKTDEQLLPSDLAAQCKRSDEVVLKKGAIVRAEEQTTDAEGGKKFFETIKAPIYDNQGKVVGLVGVSRDITERKLVEEKRGVLEKRLSKLNRYAHKLNMAKDLKEIIRLTLDAMRETLGFEYASIFVVEEKNLRMVAQLGSSKPPKLVLPIDGEMGIVVKAARKGEPVNVPDVRKDKAYVKTREGMLSELAVPMKVGNKVLGVLNVESHRLAAFGEDDRKLLEILASHAATAISNLKRREKLAALNAYGRSLNKAKRMEEIFTITLDAVQKILGFEHVDIFMVEGEKLRLVAARGLTPVPNLELNLAGDVGVIVKAAKTRESIYVPDVRKERAYFKVGSEEMLSELAVPVKIGSNVLGVLNVESHRVAAFDEEDKKLLEILASNVAIAISNIRRQERLASLSKKLEHLMKSSTKIMQIKYMHKRLRAIAKTIQKFGWRRVVISLMDENLELKHMVALGFSKEEIKKLTERKVPGHLLKELLDPKFEKYKNGEFHRLPWNDQHFSREVFSEYLTVWHPQDLLYAPIRTPEGRIVGLLAMEGHVDGRKPTRETLIPIELFLHHIATILENAQLIENLEKTREELRQYADQLEQKVKERTRELAEFQDKLLKAQRLAVIGELAGMVGHDLRNPLTSMQTAAYYMKKRLATEKIDGKIMEMIELIEKNIVYSNKIISDLLDYSRETRLDLVETSPKALVKEALSSVEIPKGIRVVNRARSTVKIKVDLEKMKRTFINLIRNAVEAMSDSGTGTLTIKSRKVGDKVMFIFSDTGVGMSEEVMKKIWIPLFTTKAKGMGFGLSICKRFVEAHGGSIDVESAVGKGTTFTVKIPIEPKTEEGGEKIWLKAQESSLLTTTKP